jgi:toxin ParE1/3/4
VPETRELVILGTAYVASYRIVGDEIQVLAVLHGARRWPDSFQ